MKSISLSQEIFRMEIQDEKCLSHPRWNVSRHANSSMEIIYIYLYE